MGSEESVPQRNRERQRSVTQNEMDRILESQRMQYEQRCWEILQANLPSTSTTLDTQRQTSSSASGNASRVRGTSPLPPRPVPHRNPRSALNRNTSVESPTQYQNNLERIRTPYSLTQDDLRTGDGDSGRNILYPNLFPANTRNTDFAFVNNKGNIVGSVPSAPSSDSLSRPQPTRSNGTANCQTCNKPYSCVGVLHIYQCPSGHSSCQECRNKVMPCGLCRRPITDMRNITLEALVSELSAPCPNKSDGCNISLKLVNMENHVKECPFKVLNCPLAAIYGTCPWKGKINQVSKHFNDMHPEHNQIGVDMEACLPNIFIENKIVNYTSIGNFNFLFCLKVSQADRKVYAVAQLLGTSISAAKWTYELQIYNKREPRRKYQLNDVCHSTWVPIDEIIKESKCGAIPLEYAMTFVNEGIINYKFFLKREVDTRSGGNKQFGRGGRRKN